MKQDRMRIITHISFRYYQMHIDVLLLIYEEKGQYARIDITAVIKAAQQSGFGEIRQVLTLLEDVPVLRELSPKQILAHVHAA